jgi:hypothetical protein
MPSSIAPTIFHLDTDMEMWYSDKTEEIKIILNEVTKSTTHVKSVALLNKYEIRRLRDWLNNYVH